MPSSEPQPPRVAIIGAGMTGLITARTLRANGVPCQVFERSRAPGGRAATRRTGEHHFDHGAQYFTQRDLRTADLLAEWVNDGVVEPWSARIAAREQGEWRDVSEAVTRWVGVPDMRVLGERLAAPERVAFDTPVSAIEREGSTWNVLAADGSSLGTFDQVLACIPAAQALALLADHAPSFTRELAAVRMLPCMATMVTLARNPRVEWDAAFVNDSPVLSWVAHEASKPGRAPQPNWVLHATAPWSAERLDAEPALVAPEMLNAFWDLLGETVPVVQAVAHRWRYAIPAPELPGATAGAQALHDEVLGLGAGGDWCAGGRVEGALLSGLALAQRLL